jgi:hypothetical protein
MNIVEKLSREIERVTVVRERFRGPNGDPQIDHIATVLIITAAIETGHIALGDGDVISIIKALRDLEALRS